MKRPSFEGSVYMNRTWLKDLKAAVGSVMTVEKELSKAILIQARHDTTEKEKERDEASVIFWQNDLILTRNDLCEIIEEHGRWAAIDPNVASEVSRCIARCSNIFGLGELVQQLQREKNQPMAHRKEKSDD